MIAYCGLVCSECEAYVATQAGDVTALEEMAARASEQFGVTFTVDSAMCDGCVSNSTRLCSYCHQCGVRACASERNVVTCAHCGDYGCEIITGFLAQAPKAQAALEEIRASL